MIKKSIVVSVGVSTMALAMGCIDSYAAEKGIVNTDVLNVRSGASTNHSVIGKLHKGNTVEIIETSGGWYKVKLSNGQTGWASGNYISKSSNPDSGGQTGYGFITTSTLNVRSGASTSHSVVAKVYKNDKVELLSSSNGWYKIKLSNGQIGWASGDYISKSSNPDSGGQTGYGFITTSTLNVRSGASTSHSVVAKVYKNDKVELLSSSNGWYKIKLSNGQIGWASGDYISKSSNPDSGGQTESGYGFITTSSLNVRSGASTSHSVVAKVYKNDKVELLSSSNGWYKIKLSNGQIGWASGDYISKTSNPDSGSDGSGSVEKPSTDDAQAAVNLAKQQIGKPYVWGAEGPNSFDCSGLMYYAYKNGAGVTLPRTSRDQSKVGTTVSKSNLQPGDLIFSSTDGSGNVSHVAIYVGNNEMIHAPKPGENVQKISINSSYWNNAYLWSKRIV